MLSLLTCAKPFVGLNGQNQARALRNWRSLDPSIEVTLYGLAEGAEEISRELGLNHVPGIATSTSGIPRFDAIAEHASKHAHHDVQIYQNCDILLSRKLLSVVKQLALPRYLLVGQRIDLAAETGSTLRWQEPLASINELAAKGLAELHKPTGMDYFVFPRGLWHGLKPLIIGRGAYDSSLVAFCLRNRIPVIDATFDLPVLHQYHDYRHLKSGLEEVQKGLDTQENRKAYGLYHSCPNTADADFVLRHGALLPNQCRGDPLRRLEIALRFKWKMGPAWMLPRALQRLRAVAWPIQPRTVDLAEVLREYAL